MVDISTVGMLSVPKKKVGDGNTLPRAFRRRIVRCWHPLGCRALEIGKTAREWCGLFWPSHGSLAYEGVAVLQGVESHGLLLQQDMVIRTQHGW